MRRTSFRARIASLAACTALAALAACGRGPLPPGSVEKPAPEAPGLDTAEGVAAFWSNGCAGCHGADGAVPLPTGEEGLDSPAGYKNIVLTLKGTILQLTVDLSKDCGPTSSGKTILLATSSGNRAGVSTGVTVGLNVTARHEPKVTDVDLTAPPAPEAAGPAPEGLQGVEVAVCGDVLTFTVSTATAQGLGDTKSGKAILLGTSNGPNPVPGTDVTCNLNVFKALRPWGPSPEVPEAPLQGGTNVACCVAGADLLLKCDLSQEHGPSTNGKSTVVGQSSGLRRVAGTSLSLSLSLSRAVEAAPRGRPAAPPKEANRRCPSCRVTKDPRGFSAGADVCALCASRGPPAKKPKMGD